MAEALSVSPLFSPRLRRGLSLAALVWFCVCLLAMAPATAAARLLQWAWPALELSAVEGSFWRGSAGQSFILIGNAGDAAQRSDARRIALGRFEWQLHGWSLLWLHPSAKISTEWGEQIVDTRLRVSPFGGIHLSELRAALPMDLLKIWAPLPARGTLTLNIDEATFDNRALRSIEGHAHWRGAQWQWGARWLALGDYRFEMTTQAGAVIAGKIGGGSDLGANGSFTADTDQKKYAIDARLTASRALPQEFRDSLVFLLRAQPIDAGANAGGPVAMTLQRSGAW